MVQWKPDGIIQMGYQVGQIVEGKVTGIQPYGAFIVIDKDISGLIHISEISDGYVKDINRFVHIGDTVRVKIIEIDLSMKQAKLSLKALNRSHARIRKRPMNRRASLPLMKKGFASIANQMDRWIREAKEEMEND